MLSLSKPQSLRAHRSGCNRLASSRPQLSEAIIQPRSTNCYRLDVRVRGHASDAQAYQQREAFLLSELASVRGQVDKLLDQQHVLLGILAAPGKNGSTSSVHNATSSIAPTSRQATSEVHATHTSFPAEESAADIPVEDAKEDSPPVLMPGDDNVLWMSKLHETLVALGYYPGDEDVDEWRFGEGTQSAVTALQAAYGLPQTGVMNSQTWARLLGAKEEPQVPVASADAADKDPPELMAGDDNVLWMSKLHETLVALGYYPGDEDVGDFRFGEGTQSAVKTLQASYGLPETGVMDSQTWGRLLGSKGEPQAQVTPTQEKAEAPVASASEADLVSKVQETLVGLGYYPGDDDVGEWKAGEGTKAAVKSLQAAYGLPETGEMNSQTWAMLLGSQEEPQAQDTTTQQDTPEEASTVDTNEKAEEATWPVVSEMDGGREVHVLQILLKREGYSCNDEDLQSWTFGDSTRNALRSYQANAGLGENGVCDESTWKSLLGAAAQPAAIAEFFFYANDDESASDNGNVQPASNSSSGPESNGTAEAHENETDEVQDKEALPTTEDFSYSVSAEAPTADLRVGDDDIFWTSKLHETLVALGYYAGDGDMDEWMMSEGTQSAVMTLQAAHGLPETGVMNSQTWAKLLGTQEESEEMVGATR